MTGKIRDYRDMDVWKEAIELALACELVCAQLPQRASYLALQLRRAADSVHSNIAEGNGRHSTADYLRLLSMSNASLNEIGSRLHFIERRYGRTKETIAAVSRCTTTARLHGGLVRSLRAKRKREG